MARIAAFGLFFQSMQESYKVMTCGDLVTEQPSCHVASSLLQSRPEHSIYA